MMLRIEEVAERWQVSTTTVRRLIKRKQLDSVRVGRLIRVHLAEVERYEGASHPADTSTDSDGQLARVKVLPAMRGGKPEGFDVLFINGVLITSIVPGNIIATALEEALKEVQS